MTLKSPSSYGGHSEGETPGPIPNPEAKPFSADGTALVTVWESRTPPDKHSRKAPPLVGPSAFPGLVPWPLPGQIMTGSGATPGTQEGPPASAGGPSFMLVSWSAQDGLVQDV